MMPRNRPTRLLVKTTAALLLTATLSGAQTPPAPPPGGPAPAARAVAATGPLLRRLVFLADAANVHQDGWPAAAASATSGAPAIDVSRIADLSDPRLIAALAPLVGQPIGTVLLGQVRTIVVRSCISRGQPFVRVVIPPQDITNGIVQVVVVKSRLGKLTVQGNRWFGQRVYLAPIRLRSGEPIDALALNDAVQWLNRSQYRHVAPVATAGAAPGTTDITLQAQDRFPLSATGGVGNSGTSATGATQMSAGFAWGNALWRGDSLNFSYTTGTDLGVMHQYSAAYTANLSPAQTLSVSGNYSRTQPVSAPGASAIGSIGTMAGVSPRYTRTMPAVRGWVGQLSAGFDWKRTNNNLLFGGLSVFNSSASIEQFTVDYSGSAADRHGSTRGGVTFVYSPGGLTAGNSDAAFSAQRQGATARYAYVRLNAERLTDLARGFAWDVRATGQLADAPLLSSEGLILGGEGSVRGFEPFAAARDEGLTLTLELRAPALSPGLPRRLGIRQGGDALSPFAFIDDGFGRQHGLAGTLVQLAAVGPGVRYQFARYASLSLSYGFIVQHTGLPTTSTGRLQVQLQASY